MKKKCRICDVALNGNNWYPSLKEKGSKICNSCNLKIGDEWRNDNRDRVNKSAAKYYKNNKRKCIESDKKCRQKLRESIIDIYGGKCSCCGITDKRILDIDHVNNDGASDGRNGIYGKSLMYKIKREDYPKDKYQILCKNCNWIKEYEHRSRL